MNLPHSFLLLTTIVYYIVNVNQYQLPEFILITMYAVPYYLFIFILIIMMLYCLIYNCYKQIIKTNDIVEQRYQLYNTFQ